MQVLWFSRVAWVVAVGFSLMAVATAAPERFLTGSSADVAGAPEPGVLLMGGGREPDDSMQWFLRRAGGGDVVVIRASGSDGYNDYFFHELGVAVDSVETLVFRSREDAVEPAVAETLAQAEAIWIAGGDQAKYVRYWAGTPVQVALNEHLTAGKPLGGTSAGLAILGEYAYSALNDSIRSDEALADPWSQDLTLEEAFVTIPVLSRIVTDTHFSERGRFGRLLAFMARASHIGGKPVAGLGVDESTALAVLPDGTGTVFSRTKKGRVFWLLPQWPEVPLLPRDEPLTLGQTLIIGLGRDSAVNLLTREVDKPASFGAIEVVRGDIEEIQ